jgi:hypothetical protein
MRFRKTLILTFIICIISLANILAQSSFYLNHGNYKKCQFTPEAIYFLNNSNVLDKTDYTGSIIWSKKLPLYTEQFAIRDNSIYFVSEFNLIKLDTAGNTIWGRDLSAQPCLSSFYIANLITDEHHIFVITRNSNWSHGGLISFDTSGTIVNSWCDFSAVMSDAILYEGFKRLSGGAWFRFFDEGTGASYAWLARADSLGNIDNSVNAIGLNFGVYDNILDVIPLPDSSYIVLNSTSAFGGFSPGSFRISLSRFKDDGTVIWQKEFYSMSAMMTAYSGGVDSSANIYFFGEKNYDFQINHFAMKVDSSGNLLLAKEWIGLPVAFNNGYTRMGYRNNLLYYSFNLSGYGACIFALDSLLTAPCGIQQTLDTLIESIIPLDTLTWPNYTPTSYLQVDTLPAIQNNSLPLSNDLCLVLSSSEILSKNNFDVFPIPSNDYFQISTDALKAQIQIYNTLGNLCLQKSISKFPAIIDVRELQPGIYILKFQTEDKWSVRKIIIQ